MRKSVISSDQSSCDSQTVNDDYVGGVIVSAALLYFIEQTFGST